MNFFKNHSQRRVFSDVNFSNLEKLLQRIYEQTEPGNAFSEHLEAEILKMFPLATNHGGAFKGSMYMLVCSKKFWIHH